MPLAFESTSHGTVAFGFFNIDSDMLLLDRYFFFATEFCEVISEMASTQDAREHVWQIYYIADPEDIGDLMGAIHAVRYTGFIGETYRRFPFPLDPEEFRQKPEGFKNRDVVEDMIKKYAERCRITVSFHEKTEEIEIGAYRFHKASFHKLLGYVWLGGMPRWKEGIRPDYVSAMREEVERSENRIFSGILFE